MKVYKYLILSVLLVSPLSLLGRDTPSEIMGLVNCGGCHTGTLGVSKDMAFTLEDPDNGFSAVTQYQPGKTYRIRLRFDPYDPDYVVGFKIASLDQPTQTQRAGYIEDPTLLAANFIRSSDDSTIAAYVDADLPTEIESIYMNWEAPESGVNVIFKLERVESNGNGGSGGDRGNLQTENFIILGPSGDDEELDEEDDTTDSSSPGTTQEENKKVSGFSGDFGGGCASIHKHQSTGKFDSGFLVGLLLVGLTFFRQLCSSRRSR